MSRRATPSPGRVAMRYATVKIPDPYKMTRREFLSPPPPPKAKPGYQLLYHTTSNEAARAIARTGLLTKYSKSPPKGSIWASPNADEFYGRSHEGALVTFQVPKRGTPADEDPYNAVYWDQGSSVIIMRDIAPEDIVDIDLEYKTDFGQWRLSRIRQGKYAATYYDKWFGPRSG